MISRSRLRREKRGDLLSLIGRTIAHYRITARLGRGAMGEVYRATDTRLDREVALKVLPEALAEDPNRLERFRREARAIAALNHPNIVTIHSVEESGQLRFITIELIEGQDFEDVICPGGLPLERILQLTLPVAEALEAAHEKGIIHRDLKPGNLMVSEQGRVKVLDFSLAKIEEMRGDDFDDASTLTGTEPGRVLGTAPYMSPEQVLGDRVDRRSDIFSLGIVLYELATGSRPFRGGSVPQVMAAVLRDDPEPLTKVRPDLGQDFSDVVSKCLSRELDDRYQTAARLAADLRQLLGPGTGAARPVPMPRQRGSLGRVAVLPLQDHSPGDDEPWFARGMHEALIAALQQVRDIGVISRTSSMSYLDSSKRLPEIAAELGAHWLVEGAVLRIDQRVRISAELIDASKDQQVGAMQHERPLIDILALQSEVARTIAREIEVALTPEEERRLAEAEPVDPRAYREYIRGLEFFDRITPADFLRSEECFRRAISIDPGFAWAHAALAIAYGIAVEYDWTAASPPETGARAATRNARRLAPGAAKTLHAQASTLHHFDRDFDEAEKAYRLAVAQTSDAYVYFGFGWMLSQMNRHEEAVAMLERAVELDPRSAPVRSDLGWWLFGARRYDRAIDAARKTLQLDPTFGEAHWLLAACYSQKGEFDDALASFDRYEILYGEPVPWFRGYLNGLAGRKTVALAALEELERQIESGAAQPILAAQTCLGLGEMERVVEILELAPRAGVSFQPYLWPEYEALHSEPRFLAVLQRFRLPLPSMPPDRSDYS